MLRYLRDLVGSTATITIAVIMASS